MTTSQGSGYQPVRGVQEASLLIWGEHCNECAEPSCYSTCNLYESRPDRRCRLFTLGAVPNPAFTSWRGEGVEMEFKPWSKMESRGNTLMAPAFKVLSRERLMKRAAPLLNAGGRVVHRLRKNDVRWCYISVPLYHRMLRKMHRQHDGSPPQAFLLEVYNPTSEALPLMLWMDVAKKELPADCPLKPPYPFFKKTIVLEPGYNRAVIPHHEFSQVTDCGYPFDIALAPENDGLAKLVMLSADFVRFAPNAQAALLGADAPAKPSAPAEAKKAPDIKCVVWDLDNTMWQGILVEQAELVPNQEAIETIKALDKRGILNSVVSKNNFDDAWAYLKQLGIEEYFLYPQINWHPKGENVRRIAQRLNINIDTFALVDDNPFEREEVTNLNPEVLALDVDQVPALLDHPRFQGSSSDEAGMRRQMYQNTIEREQEQERLGVDYLEFLRSCQIVLEVEPFDEPYRGRVTELVQRTNQLNFSGRHYSEQYLGQMLDDPSREKWVLKCSDKFGTYGIVGFGLVRREEEEITVLDFMLSCRVQGKFIEQAFFKFLVDKQPHGLPKLIKVNLRPTDRNMPAQQVLRTIGFVPGAEENTMELSLEGQPFECDFITIKG
ncbi:MAG: HAD-IIIC family phosphatase [Desulfarculaceae bacterium]|nr:HAD-IIIC family phosphatase [Desulfarculaceae bacterium]MCF8074004.1 HAD-IIIC family phosphatase [Desulfarculaceae bacterium]MCF8102690.1 HAD-IIIC family phosphatase [Desulfarculaceae bacterium]MCF8116069.1 HAD-IIIC family phosphatase [Desulfarculaceae bacterium]